MCQFVLICFFGGGGVVFDIIPRPNHKVKILKISLFDDFNNRFHIFERNS